MSTSPYRFSLAALLLGVAFAGACGSSEAPGALRDTAGRAAFAVTGLDVSLSSLTFSIENAAGELVQERTEDGSADGLAFELDLPAGAGYVVRVNAQTDDGQSCTGSSSFDVAVGRRSEVALTLSCSATGQVSVVGTLTPACPQVAITTTLDTLAVGASIVLETNADATLPTAPTWAASAGELAVVEGATRFTCTAPGPVSITLRAGPESCEGDSVTVTCAATPTASACDGLGSNCHVVGEGNPEAEACHEMGHAGDEAVCAESRASCVNTCGAALCTTLASLCHDVDPGEGPLHECHELAHAADAAACFSRGRECFDLCTRAHQEPVTVTFEARVGAAAFECGVRVEGVGSSDASAEPRDFRLFVHDVRLIDADGNAAPVELDERAPWQARGVALLDFEDGSGGCVEGDVAVNATVTGRVAPGTYTGLAFRVGVPDAVNHDDPATQPAPLAAGTMSWGWLSGYKFLRADLGTESAGGVIHLGATGCTGDPATDSVTCARANRPEVTLDGFDPATSRVVADVGGLFAGVDLDSAGPCHSAGDACGAMFESLGVDLASGQSTGEQSVFSIE